MSETTPKLDIGLPFPIEFLILDTPRSLQGKNSKGKERWKTRVGELAKAHVATLREWTYLDGRPLAPMEGDVDNIVKLLLDGMCFVMYPDDEVIERVIVQKFEPGVEAVFRALTETLEKATEMKPPVIYIRIDDDLSWREVS